MSTELLTFTDHSRHFNHCKYVYPVLSRRAKGISLGINLNLNNTCNWKCIYCQVEGLTRGKPESLDMVLLEHELSGMLEWISNGDFIQKFAPNNMQRLNDICLAGNGEPTLSPDFLAVCELITKLRDKYNISTNVKTILITNGSQVSQQKVRQGLTILSKINGEIWFKIDRIHPESILQTNQVNLSAELISKNLILASQHCKTLIQSCWFANNGIFPTQREIIDFTTFIIEHRQYIDKILLYSVARPTAQAEGKHIYQFTQNDFNFLENIFIQNNISYQIDP